MQRKIRVLVGKPGLDGHDRGAKVVAAALRDAGMEVIYTGLHQSPEQVVEAALQEDVDVVALSILSGAHMTLFTDVLKLMKERGISDKLLTGGGIIPAEDMQTLSQMGVGRLFGPGASTQEIAEYIREWCAERYGAGSFAPAPEPRREKAQALPNSRTEIGVARGSKGTRGAATSGSKSTPASSRAAKTPRSSASSSVSSSHPATKRGKRAASAGGSRKSAKRKSSARGSRSASKSRTGSARATRKSSARRGSRSRAVSARKR